MRYLVHIEAGFSIEADSEEEARERALEIMRQEDAEQHLQVKVEQG